jgi:hypothetical protein
MSNFTDLENSIMDCWGITDELQHLAEYGSDARIVKLLQSLATVYDFKMERLNDLFENCLKEYYELKNKKPLLDVTIERIATKHADIGGDIPADKWIAFAREVIEADEDYIPW